MILTALVILWQVVAGLLVLLMWWREFDEPTFAPFLLIVLLAMLWPVWLVLWVLVKWWARKAARRG